MMLFAGAVVGVEQAADGGERINITDRLEDELFYENGTLNTTASDAEPAPFEAAAEERVEPVFPESPGADRWIQQHVAGPMISGMIWIAGVGFALGYGMASTIGATASRLLLNAAVMSLVIGVAWRTYRIVREVAR